MSIPVLIGVVLGIIVAIAQKSNQKKNTKSTTKEKQATAFEIMQIQSRGVQLLESLEIMATTKNLDTLQGRMDFVLDFYSSLITLASFKQRFFNEAQVAIDTYKERYYDKVLKVAQVSLLITPSMDDLKAYFANCIVICYGEFVKVQAEEMSRLKRQSAIEKRKENIIDIGYSAKYLFSSYDLPNNGHQEAIEKLREQFYSNVKAAQ